jgi:hypothetical protein
MIKKYSSDIESAFFALGIQAEQTLMLLSQTMHDIKVIMSKSAHDIEASFAIATKQLMSIGDTIKAEDSEKLKFPTIEIKPINLNWDVGQYKALMDFIRDNFYFKRYDFFGKKPNEKDDKQNIEPTV